MSGRLVVVGDALLDRDVEGRVDRLCPEAPVPVLDEGAVRSRPGGAGLAATLAARDGREVVLVTALSGDAAGRELRRLLDGAGVDVVDLGLAGPTPVKTRLRSDGRLLLRLDGGNGGGRVGHTEQAQRALDGAAAVLVSDYARGVVEATRSLLVEADAPLVWDPHPRGGRPVVGARLATPNRSETAALVPEPAGETLKDWSERAATLARRWQADAVAVTLGADGALLVSGVAPPLLFPVTRARGGDPCGAGDRFAASAAGRIADGAWLPDAVGAAAADAAEFVARGGAGAVAVSAPEPSPASSADDLVERIRARGGTVVATGGCFDLLHAGHVATLEAARALGDCLVVLLNSDASVARLKGSDRPLVSEDDRAAVLSALACVDAVVVFDEDTPEVALERLRPHVFAKGGDYALEELPEAPLLESWGGQAVVLPYVEGRSTTRLLEEVASRAAR